MIQPERPPRPAKGRGSRAGGTKSLTPAKPSSTAALLSLSFTIQPLMISLIPFLTGWVCWSLDGLASPVDSGGWGLLTSTPHIQTLGSKYPGDVPIQGSTVR